MSNTNGENEPTDDDRGAPAERRFGANRRRLIRIVDALFVALLALMLLAGALVVVVQLVGIVVGSSNLVDGDLATAFVTAACLFGGLLGILSLVQARTHGWKPTD